MISLDSKINAWPTNLTTSVNALLASKVQKSYEKCPYLRTYFALSLCFCFTLLGPKRCSDTCTGYWILDSGFWALLPVKIALHELNWDWNWTKCTGLAACLLLLLRASIGKRTELKFNWSSCTRQWPYIRAVQKPNQTEPKPKQKHT